MSFEVHVNGDSFEIHIWKDQEDRKGYLILKKAKKEKKKKGWQMNNHKLSKIKVRNIYNLSLFKSRMINVLDPER